MNKSTESDLKSHLIWPRAEIEDATAQYIEDCTELNWTLTLKTAHRQLLEVLMVFFENPRRAIGGLALKTAPPSYYSRRGDGLLPILKNALGTHSAARILSKSIGDSWRLTQIHRV